MEHSNDISYCIFQSYAHFWNKENDLIKNVSKINHKNGNFLNFLKWNYPAVKLWYDVLTFFSQKEKEREKEENKKGESRDR